MTTRRIRYLVQRPGVPLQRYYWQPSSELRALGWKPVRVPDQWASFHDAAALDRAAIVAAEVRNAELDAWLANRQKPSAKRRKNAATVADLIRAYEKAGYPPIARRGDLAPKTVLGYRQHLRTLEDRLGSLAYGAIGTATLRPLYDDLARKTPAKAAAVLRMAQTLFSFARLKGWRQDNPADRLGLAGAAPSGLIWPREAVDAFVETADRIGRPSIGTAVLLNEWLGQRQGDILTLPRNLLDGHSHILRQHKTGAAVRLPIAAVPRLVGRIHAELARGPGSISNMTLIVREDDGALYTADSFRHAFAIVRATLVRERQTGFTLDHFPAGREHNRIAVTDLKFLHLRHTAVVRLAEAGCTIPEIAAITGHTLKTVEQILERYLVRTGILAETAFAKRLAAEAD